MVFFILVVLNKRSWISQEQLILPRPQAMNLQAMVSPLFEDSDIIFSISLIYDFLID